MYKIVKNSSNGFLVFMTSGEFRKMPRNSAADMRTMTMSRRVLYFFLFFVILGKYRIPSAKKG